MSLTMRLYTNDDYWTIREFLRAVFGRNQFRPHSWDVVRWDYWRWHGNENIEHFKLDEVIFIWENADGKIAAVLNPEGHGEAFFQVHPDFRSPQLEAEMLEVAETHLAQLDAQGCHRLHVWANADDELRQTLLSARGYTRGKSPEYQRRRMVSREIPDAPIAPGYTLRALGEVSEHPARSWVSWQAFHPAEPAENYRGWEWYRNVQRAPLYRRDLDLVAVAPSGEFAAFCTVWFDDVNRTGVFEPVGTSPAHQRRGLGKALMREGLRRLDWLGATRAYVGSYSPAAHALYASAGFIEYDVLERWAKTWSPDPGKNGPV